MKNRLFILLLIFCLLLTGCGGAPAASEEPEKPATEETEESAPKEEAGEEEALPEAEPEMEAEPEPDPEPVTVAGELDFSGYNSVPENALPDLLYWANGAAEYEDEPTTSDGKQVYEYRTSQPVVEEYIEMLCQNGYTLVDSYTIGDLYSWGLMSDTVDAVTQPLIFTDNPCHVAIWTNGGRTFRVDVPFELEVCDTGTRRGGEARDLAPEGPSASVGLLRLPDGSYQTSDGRLTAAVGTAAVLRDGQPYSCEASLIIDGEREIESLWIENYYRNEGIYFESPEAYLMADDVFRMSDLSRERIYDTDKDSQDAYNWGGCYVSVCHNGEWITPTWNGTDYEALTVRVMYDDKGGDRVYYIYARFSRGEPTEVEALCAVSSGSKTGSFSDARYLQVGETTTIHYEWEEFGSMYHVYEWEVIEGGNNVVLDGPDNDCRVTAVRPGVAVVKMSYSYTREEPDVLTGAPRDVGHTRTEEYVFVIE